MKTLFKAPLLAAILGLAIYSSAVCAETSSDTGSTASPHPQKAPAQSADQPAAKNPAASSRAASVKESSAADKADPAVPPPVIALQGPALFKQLDTDKDGRISPAEFIAYGTAADARTNASGTASAGGKDHDRRDPPAGSTPDKAGPKSEPAKATSADHPPAVIPEPPSPGPSLQTSTKTRADRYTAEVFEILDVDHDKFLTQAELDALVGAHQISQP